MTMPDVTAEERVKLIKLIHGAQGDALPNEYRVSDAVIAAGWRPSPPVEQPQPEAVRALVEEARARLSEMGGYLINARSDLGLIFRLADTVETLTKLQEPKP